MPRIYLDNAATSWPKPQTVYKAVDWYQRDIGASAGRSGYRSAIEAERLLSQTRAAAARLIGTKGANSVVFASSGTDALNMAIHGIMRPGDHVVTTVTEHNSVLRPLRYLAELADITVDYVPCDKYGFVSPGDVRRAITPATRLVCVNHGSNVTGAVQDLEEIAKLVTESNAQLLVDAAQTLGHLEVNVESLPVDLLAAPGHKGLLGPLGTGLLYIRPGLEREMKSMRQGGTGSQSNEDQQPETMPEKFECGNLNMSGLAGLKAGLDFVESETIEKLADNVNRMTVKLIEEIEELPHVNLIGPPACANRLPVVSLLVEGYDPQDVAAMFDASYGIDCRAGFHCAARIHVALGTDKSGGTLRLSSGFATSEVEIDSVLQALCEMKQSDV